MTHSPQPPIDERNPPHPHPSTHIKSFLAIRTHTYIYIFVLFILFSSSVCYTLTTRRTPLRALAKTPTKLVVASISLSSVASHPIQPTHATFPKGSENTYISGTQPTKYTHVAYNFVQYLLAPAPYTWACVFFVVFGPARKTPTGFLRYIICIYVYATIRTYTRNSPNPMVIVIWHPPHKLHVWSLPRLAVAPMCVHTRFVTRPDRSWRVFHFFFFWVTNFNSRIILYTRITNISDDRFLAGHLSHDLMASFFFG